MKPKCASAAGRDIKCIAEVIGESNCDIKKIAFACDAMMDRGGGQQVPHIIELMIAQIGPILLVVAELHWCADVAVCQLRLRDDRDQRVQFIEDRRRFGQAVYMRPGFHIFVAVTIAPHRAFPLTILQASGDMKVAEYSAIVRLVKRPAHARQHRLVTQLE